MQFFEELLFKKTVGFKSRFKVLLYQALGMTLGRNNRFEAGRCRRLSQIQIGAANAFTKGYMLWPIDEEFKGKKITIGSNNYFNRNIMIDACGSIAIGNENMFGPDIYITDSDHSFGTDISPAKAPMNVGSVKIGNQCWIGAKAIILKNVVLGDRCIVAAGTIVTKSFAAGSLIAGVPARLIKSY